MVISFRLSLPNDLHGAAGGEYSGASCMAINCVLIILVEAQVQPASNPSGVRPTLVDCYIRRAQVSDLSSVPMLDAPLSRGGNHSR